MTDAILNSQAPTNVMTLAIRNPDAIWHLETRSGRKS